MLSRTPSLKELALLRGAYDRDAALFAGQPTEASKLLDQGESPMPRKIGRPELAAWTQVASILLNLDETITRQ